MVSDGKKRVQVTFSDKVLQRLDAFCETTGMTKSAYISYVVATNLDQYERMTSAACMSIENLAQNETDN